MHIDDFDKKLLLIKEQANKILAEDNQNYEILYLGATKNLSVEEITKVDDGKVLDILAENRTQEFVKKHSSIKNSPYHFIGKLQRRNAKYLVGIAQVIQSVHSIELIEEINNIAQKRGVVQKIFLQVNVGKEESKSGFFPEEMEGVLDNMQKYKNVFVSGLMAVTPIAEEYVLIRLYRELNALYEKVKNITTENIDIKYLSAGMTDDYLIAIKYARANIVRLGRGLFGSRD